MTKSVVLCRNGLCGDCYRCRLTIACNQRDALRDKLNQVIRLLVETFAVARDKLEPAIAAEVEEVLADESGPPITEAAELETQ